MTDLVGSYSEHISEKNSENNNSLEAASPNSNELDSATRAAVDRVSAGLHECDP